MENAFWTLSIAKIVMCKFSDLCSRWFGLQPSEEFEATANSLGAHIETRKKLILRTPSYLTVNSQDDSHCEIAVNRTFAIFMFTTCPYEHFTPTSPKKKIAENYRLQDK